MAVNLDMVKAHLRIDGFDDEDQILSLYLEAAQDAAALYIGWETLPEEVPPSVEAGILMFVGTLYNTREDVTETKRYKVPMAVERLWAAHRDHGVY